MSKKPLDPRPTFTEWDGSLTQAISIGISRGLTDMSGVLTHCTPSMLAMYALEQIKRTPGLIVDDAPDPARLALQQIRDQPAGADLIAAERQRQIDVEGYTPALDAEHYRDNQLVRAAMAYLTTDQPNPWYWPWPPSTFKPSPKDRVRELVKAGALIAAEIDRFQRTTDRVAAVLDAAEGAR